MSAQPKPKDIIPIAAAGRRATGAGVKSADALALRASQELVLAFMGAVGCGLARVVTVFEKQLRDKGYLVVRIKLSEFIKEQISTGSVVVPPEERAVRYLAYQTGGNQLREHHGNEVMAQYAINQITRHRLSADAEYADLGKAPPRVAYLIDQIKHPDEVHLLRMVYRNLFFLIGVMSTQEHRKSRLGDEGLDDKQIDDTVTRDRKESAKSGQQLEKAFKLADYFMHHPLGDVALVPEQIARFVDLIHGSNKITPTKHEHAMYVAHSAALKSSCMSRQVGAAVTDRSDRIIAVGTNDVPQYGGGLYSTDSGDNDDRCFNRRGECENNAEKARRKERIREGILADLPKIFPDTSVRQAAERKVSELVELVFAQSGIPDLIEFSRAVHAEMDALISLSRGGGGSTVGGNLYTTTFPCHNCARHIIAAGIDKVYYIEPYEKSLAPDAHKDAIEVLDHDYAQGDRRVVSKVKFIHFSGVGPRLYSDLFLRDGGRKSENGKLIPYSSAVQDPPNRIIKEYIDSYRTFETKIATLFTQEFQVQDDGAGDA
jgi:deoxycytidylate deaminase